MIVVGRKQTTMKVLYLLILFFTVMGCQKTPNNKEMPREKMIFGKWETLDENLDVNIDYSNLSTWNELLEAANTIACNDSVPKIRLSNEKTIKDTYFLNDCREKGIVSCLMQRDIISIHNDTVSKYDEFFYPLDSLESVLKREIYYDGTNPKFNTNPDYLIINISYDEKSGFKSLPNTLNRLTETYYRITNKTDINIKLGEKAMYPVPPPPPPYH